MNDTNAGAKLEWTKMPYEREVHHSNVVEHGMVDEKGRAVGGYVAVEDRLRYIEGTKTTETCYGVRCYATRNGKQYGASPHPTVVSTVEEGKALAAGLLAAQGKRYAKKYAQH